MLLSKCLFARRIMGVVCIQKSVVMVSELIWVLFFEIYVMYIERRVVVTENNVVG